MTKRYSKRFLRTLRNQIPIATLIADFLYLPNKASEGYFRFLCPNCSEFNTATNQKTNLARCFSCKKNFNTIDIVMAVNHVCFKDAVEYLNGIVRCDTDGTKKPVEDQLGFVSDLLKSI